MPGDCCEETKRVWRCCPYRSWVGVRARDCTFTARLAYALPTRLVIAMPLEPCGGTPMAGPFVAIKSLTAQIEVGCVPHQVQPQHRQRSQFRHICGNIVVAGDANIVIVM